MLRGREVVQGVVLDVVRRLRARENPAEVVDGLAEVPVREPDARFVAELPDPREAPERVEEVVVVAGVLLGGSNSR